MGSEAPTGVVLGGCCVFRRFLVAKEDQPHPHTSVPPPTSAPPSTPLPPHDIALPQNLFRGRFSRTGHHDNVLRDRGLLGQGRREDSSEGSESDKMPSSRPASRRHGLLWLTAMQDLSQLLPKDQPIPIGRKRTARGSADVALAGSTSNPVAESSEARRSFEFTQLQRINRAVADG